MWPLRVWAHSPFKMFKKLIFIYILQLVSLSIRVVIVVLSYTLTLFRFYKKKVYV